MKVAIIGSGLAGLACAFELEKHGITPTIFEKGSVNGKQPGFSIINLKILFRFMEDPLEFFLNQYGLKLTPLSSLEHAIMVTEGKRVNIKANLGYTFRRGIEKHSLENQIAAQVKTPINFESFVDIDAVLNDYDYIVVATGDSFIAKKMNIWTDTFFSMSRIATILCDYKMDTSNIWFNTEYCKNGFGFLVPNNPKEATLALIVTDVRHTELDFYWDKFLSKEKINYTVLQKSDVESNAGLISTFVKDNVYFTGNAAGLIDDVIGVGSFNAIESGIFAARSIVTGEDYNDMIKLLYKEISKIHEIRKAINKFNNSDYDRVVSILETPGIQQILYNTPFVKMSFATPIAKLFNSINEK